MFARQLASENSYLFAFGRKFCNRVGHTSLLLFVYSGIVDVYTLQANYFEHSLQWYRDKPDIAKHLGHAYLLLYELEDCGTAHDVDEKLGFCFHGAVLQIAHQLGRIIVLPVLLDGIPGQLN